jgi:hypothetical protein
MSVTNTRTEIQVARSEAPDSSINFPLRDQQYQKFSDNNQGNYSGNNILFDLNSISNSQQFLSFADSFVIVPVVELVQFTGTASTATNRFDFRSWRSKLISTIKGTACSIINGLQLELNNEQVLSYTTGSHVPMEFMQISSYDSDDFELSYANDAVMSDYSEEAGTANYFQGGSATSIQNSFQTGSPWLPVSQSTAAGDQYMSTTHTHNFAYYKKMSKLASNARNDVVTAFLIQLNIWIHLLLVR